MKEKQTETKIKQWLREQGYYFFKVHGSEFMEAGIPDIVACVHGLFVGIEVKAPGKKSTQSPHQKIHEQNIHKANGVYLLVDDFDEFVTRIGDVIANKKLFDYNVQSRDWV